MFLCCPLLVHCSVAVFVIFFFAGYQIEPCDNPADFFMDITNGEAKSTHNTITAGTLYTQHMYDLLGDLWQIDLEQTAMVLDIFNL